MFAYIKSHAITVAASVAAVAAVAGGIYFYCHKAAETVAAATE